MSTFRITCPFCKKTLEADDAWDGMELPCPNCKQMVSVRKSSGKPHLVIVDDDTQEDSVSEATGQEEKTKQTGLDAGTQVSSRNPGTCQDEKIFTDNNVSSHADSSAKRPKISPQVEHCNHAQSFTTGTSDSSFINEEKKKKFLMTVEIVIMGLIFFLFCSIQYTDITYNQWLKYNTIYLQPDIILFVLAVCLISASKKEISVMSVIGTIFIFIVGIILITLFCIVPSCANNSVHIYDSPNSAINRLDNF